MTTQTTPAAKVKPQSQEPKIYPLLQMGSADALVIHCSDPRFQEAFHSFLRDELNIKVPAIIAIPGSSSAFGAQMFLPKGWHALRKQIEVMAELNQYPRVILINHDDCRAYARLAEFLGGLAKIRLAQKTNLKSLAEYILKEHLPRAQVELYQAHIVPSSDQAGVQFEKVF